MFKESNFKDIRDILITQQGIDISNYDTSFLENAIQKRMSETKSETVQNYSAFLTANTFEINTLVDSLIINYSEFFRNPLTFSVIERILLPLLLQKKKKTNQKELRIWSTACSTGQEPYSLAILLKELAYSDIQYRIFATDKCETMIQNAKRGVYSESAIKKLTLQRLHKWFTKQQDLYQIDFCLQSCIDFSVFDLCTEQNSSPAASIFGEFDIVFCANVLFYYKEKQQQQIIEKITRSLVSGGYIIVGEAERKIMLKNNFFEVYPQSAIFQK